MDHYFMLHLKSPRMDWRNFNKDLKASYPDAICKVDLINGINRLILRGNVELFISVLLAFEMTGIAILEAKQLTDEAVQRLLAPTKAYRFTLESNWIDWRQLTQGMLEENSTWIKETHVQDRILRITMVLTETEYKHALENWKEMGLKVLDTEILETPEVTHD